jgi:FixJ family two-component response regulator
MSELPKVHLIDDDAAIRDALVLLLSLRGIPVAAYETAESALQSIGDDPRGCVITDLRMPGMNGLEFMRQLVDRGARLPVIMLTAHGDVATTRAALRGGAFDFLEKPIDEDILFDVLKHALAEDEQRHRAQRETEQKRERISSLTQRELQVLGLLGRGQQNREIAVTLSISPRTVEVYKARMMEKLGCQTIADVVKMSMLLENMSSNDAAKTS